MKIQTSSIRLDGGTQPRAAEHADWIEDYAADMLGGASFPPVVVFFDGSSHWLADGFHRTRAALAAGLDEIDADVRQGSRRDAVLFSVSANAEHGHRRTNGDKRRAVLLLLNDPEWGEWSDGEIARRCVVSPHTVAKLRPVDTMQTHSVGRTFTHPKTGQPTVMNTAAIGRPASVPEPTSLPQEEEAPILAYIEKSAQGEMQVAVPDIAPEATTGVVPEPPLAQSSTPETFDWDAANIRNRLMDTIKTLAELPPVDEAIQAWMKHTGYGVPIETVSTAASWLSSFAARYRQAEPVRAAAVEAIIQKSKELANVAA